MARTTSNLTVLVATAAMQLCLQPGLPPPPRACAGRYIPGAYAGPGAGIVPPMPGVAYWAISNLYYHGEASGDVPFGNNTIALGLEADMWATVFAGVYVPEIDLPGNWTYAVQAAVPVGWTRATRQCRSRSTARRRSPGSATSRSCRCCSAGTTMP